MANKRDLKKQIKIICEDIATECMFAADYVKDVDAETMYGIVGKIANLHQTALSHASFAFDKVPADFESMREYHKARASYFKKAYSSLRDKFNSHVQDIVKKMNAALPAQVKEANKKA